MPELPDVESFKRYLDATALHQRIVSVHVGAPRLLEKLSASQLDRRLHGHAFASTRRHGKYLFAQLDDGEWLVLHFGMTGHLDYGKPDGVDTDAEMSIDFDNDYRLAYIAPRKLGRIALTDDPDAYLEQQALGPDALTLDLDAFRELARGRRGGVKCWLMNQEVMAGIGNVYSDEILFQAGLHPKSDISRLNGDALRRLHRAMQRVLNQAADAQADPERMPESFLLPRREADAACPRCDGKVASLKACGRTAWYCPVCQPKSD